MFHYLQQKYSRAFYDKTGNKEKMSRSGFDGVGNGDEGNEKSSFIDRCNLQCKLE